MQEDGDSILLPDAKHSGFVPTPGKAIHAATLKLWAGVLDEAEAQAEAAAARQRRRQRAGILSYSKP
jgi:phage protein D